MKAFDRLVRSNFRQLRLVIRRLCSRSTPHGFTRIGRYQPDDVFVAGYPKSGNTWMQLLVAGIVYGLDPKTAPDTLIQELVPDVHYKPFYKRLSPRMIFKTHDLPRPEYRRVINLIRDGRDVLCSYRHFSEALGASFDMNQMVEGNGSELFGTWWDHVDAWNKNPFGAEKIVVRYEDLREDCVGQLARIAKFLGISRGTHELERLAVATEFQQMRQRETTLGWDNKAWPFDKPFVRQGKKGAFLQEMTASQIHRFEAFAGRSLVTMGYALSSIPGQSAR